MDSERLFDLENRIRRSGDFVAPSDTLRGRVVSEVLRRQSGNEIISKLYRICCVFLIGNTCALMAANSLDRWWDEHSHLVTSSELLRKADQIQKQHKLDPSESLAEAYSQWKSQLATHWKTAPISLTP
ncbi:MAG: hypothetical protein ACKO8U_03485 [Pirellula sp.]